MRWSFLCILCVHCKVKDPPPITEPWSDAFDRTGLGENYYSTGAGYELSAGALSAKRAHNHPLWLRKKLTRDVRVEFDCWSNDKRGDIKVEIFGDGHSYDRDGGRYLATGYVLIFGGWSNSRSIVARMDEHGSDVVQRTLPHVVAGQHYHWTIERRGQKVTWWIDVPPRSLTASAAQPSAAGDADAAAMTSDLNAPFLVYDDPHPLEGSGHQFVGFNNWETDTWFDNLVVTPL